MLKRQSSSKSQSWHKLVLGTTSTYICSARILDHAWQGRHLPNFIVLVFVNTHYSALCPVLSTSMYYLQVLTTQCLLADSVLQSPNQNGIYIKLHTIFRYSAVPGPLLNLVCFTAPLAVPRYRSFAFKHPRSSMGWNLLAVELWPSCMLCTHLLASTLHAHQKSCWWAETCCHKVELGAERMTVTNLALKY